jgi:hypothetical protein
MQFARYCFEKMLEESLGAIRGLKNTLIADSRGKMPLPNARKTELP